MAISTVNSMPEYNLLCGLLSVSERSKELV